jgi:hypothetical protein
MQPANVPDSSDRQTQGAALESVGIISQSDYLRLHRLVPEAQASGVFSDAELDWALGLLANNPEPSGRSLVMVIVATVCEIVSPSAVQRQKISVAVAPFLQADHKLDRLSAAHVEKILAANP